MALTRAVLLVTAIILITGCAKSEGRREPPAERQKVTVTRVVDGDTVEVNPAVFGSENVRLIGVDAPETAGSPRGQQPYGERAARFVDNVLEGEQVTLEFDEEKTDDYGRTLAYLYSPDGKMFNRTLLARGYAQVATFPPNVSYIDRFERTQRTARSKDRGLWGLPNRRLCRLTDRGNGVGGSCKK
ncbi:thermonuclease family protein [soil metagenome]